MLHMIYNITVYILQLKMRLTFPWLLPRVSILDWLKSFILKATYPLYLCPAKFYFYSSTFKSPYLMLSMLAKASFYSPFDIMQKSCP